MQPAAGWIIGLSMLASMGVIANGPEAQAKGPTFTTADCEGTYRHHLQGICTDKRASVFWSFTTTLLRTDQHGKIVKRAPVGNHHGDLCHHDGKIYVAVNFGQFNDPEGKADSWVYVYDANDLSLLAKHKTPEVFYGAGGIAYHGGKFIVVGGLPKGVEENHIYEYDQDFKFVKEHVVKSGQTRFGIQTATFANGHWWFGCYGKKLLKTDESFKLAGKYDLDCGLGIVGVSGKTFLVGRGSRMEGNGHTGSVLLADMDQDRGLVIWAE